MLLVVGAVKILVGVFERLGDAAVGLVLGPDMKIDLFPQERIGEIVAQRRAVADRTVQVQPAGRHRAPVDFQQVLVVSSGPASLP